MNKTKRVKIIGKLTKELFDNWNLQNKEDVKCANFICPNSTVNAVKVSTESNKNYIVPLCEECYQEYTSSTKMRSQDIIDLGVILLVDTTCMMKI